jgi:predicted transcriptional regulator
MPASVKDVAALAGVSASTVSNYLNRPEVVAENSRIRIEEDRGAALRTERVRSSAPRRDQQGRCPHPAGCVAPVLQRAVARG